MNTTVILLLIVFGLTIVMNLVKKYLINKYSVDIIKAMAEDEKTFNDLIDKKTVKLLFEPFNREYTRMNYYIAHDNMKKLNEQLELLETGMRLNKRQKYAVYQQAFQYYLSKAHPSKTREYQKKINEFVDENNYDPAIKEELKISVGIFIDKDKDLLPVLTKKIETDTDNAGNWYMRRAYLYNGLNNDSKAREDLEKAYELTSEGPQKELIKALLETGFNNK